MTFPKTITGLVTVAIPTYNHGHFLKAAIQSVIQQTYNNFEIMIVDNFSTDNTGEIIASFNDSRIKWVKIRNNGSIAASRTRVLADAKGEWIAFLDSDDWWSNTKLEECSKYFNPGIDLIYHDLHQVSSNSPELRLSPIKSRQVNKPVLLDLLLKGNTIATSSVVVRTLVLQRVGGMNESHDLISTEDYNTWLRISEITENFHHIEKFLGYYRLHDQSISHTANYQPPREAIAQFLPRLSERQRRQIEANLFYTKGRILLRSKRYFESRENFKKVLNHGRFTQMAKAIFFLSICYLFV